MKLIVTADLHYNIARSQEPTRELAGQVCSLQADALLVLGDIGGEDLGIVRDCLRLFDQFDGRKLFVAGNHELWTEPGQDSLERLEQLLPAVCREAGFHPLDVEPATVDGIGLVGSIGWYDFSYREPSLEIPLRFYEAKIAPGAASRLGGYEHLLADTSDVPEATLQIGTRWMDGQHVRLPMSDVDFCRRLCDRFNEHLETVANQCDTIIAGLHHLPFQELIPENHDPGWTFASAFMGSELFGQALLAQPKVRYALCAHSHYPSRIRREHLECINVGCTYNEKRYEVVEV